jgi:hypothetical protein
MRQSGKAAAVVLAFLRARPGEKLFPRDIARETRIEVETVSTALSRQFTDARYCRNHLQRELGAADGRGCPRGYCYWIEAPREREGELDIERKARRWMLRNPRAARPSEIAGAIGFPEREVARLLERWTREGAAVRCRLLTRTGVDRFEYRLAAASARLFTTIRERRVGEVAL